MSDTTTVTVPTEHASLIQRAIAVLEKGGEEIKTSIEYGISHFESLFKSDSEDKAAAEPASTEPPAA